MRQKYHAEDLQVDGRQCWQKEDVIIKTEYSVSKYVRGRNHRRVIIHPSEQVPLQYT